MNAKYGRGAGQSVIGVLLLMSAWGAVAGEDEWLVPLGQPPRAAPRRISGGEGVPPLPLPATPLRRSERKREPAPPTFIGKVVWGESAEYTYADGQTAQVADWNLCPDDVAQLMRKTGRWFGMNYGSQAVSLASFEPDPALTPVLFFSGVRTLKMTDQQLALLRQYVSRGGMIVFDSIAGSPYFHDAALRISRQLVPDEPVRAIPLDHPLYHMLADATQVKYGRNLDSTQPALEGLYVGSRIACLVSRYGLGCGWDDHDVPLLEKAVFYDVDSANRLGINMVAYAVGYADAARQEARPEAFGLIDEKRPTDELVFAQIRHGGAWNVHPGAAATLLRRMRQETSLGVSLKRVSVELGKDDSSKFAFLYLEGLDDFVLSGAEVDALRAFLDRGGTLVVNNGLGLSTFDQAVRRELARVLPGHAFADVPADHAVFSAVRPIPEATYTPLVQSLLPSLRQPVLEAITIDTDLRVIYSKYDMAGAWLGCDYPLSKAYASESGAELGMNVLMYAMTH
jgi:hypothetical protein